MRDSDNYYCSKKNLGCRARVKVSRDGRLLKNTLTPHSHPPPEYVITSSGDYVKIRT